MKDSTALKGLRAIGDLIAKLLRLRQPEGKIRSEALRFWGEHTAPDHGVNSHWRGHGIFADDDNKWRSMGERHRAIFDRLAAAASTKPAKPLAILEWGCGGGSNAVAFGAIASRFVAVDISAESVNECLRQLKLHGIDQAVGIVADIHEPEKAVESLVPVDVLICTYVFELLPTREYALRLLRLFKDKLVPGGIALIQIRYATSRRSTHGRSWGYRLGFARMVAFFIDEFWLAASEVGFRPVCIELLPFDETVSDDRYAYFLLEKPRPLSKGVS